MLMDDDDEGGVDSVIGRGPLEIRLWDGLCRVTILVWSGPGLELRTCVVFYEMRDL